MERLMHDPLVWFHPCDGDPVRVDVLNPVRVCCGERHWGPVCPDGMVMCCTCSGRFETHELHVDVTGTTWDMCAGCGKDVGE